MHLHVDARARWRFTASFLTIAARCEIISIYILVDYYTLAQRGPRGGSDPESGGIRYNN